MTVRHDREFWESACREIRRGAKIVEVARRLGVRPRTLQWWSWKLRGERKVAAEFLPIVVADSTAAIATTIELETNGVRLRVEGGTDVRYVAALVAAIRAAC